VAAAARSTTVPAPSRACTPTFALDPLYHVANSVPAISSGQCRIVHDRTTPADDHTNAIDTILDDHPDIAYQSDYKHPAHACRR
jgi:hypothetical protein